MASAQGLSLEFSDRRTVPDTLEGVNAELLKIGAGVWPLDLKHRPEDIRTLRRSARWTNAKPNEVADGGALITVVTNQGYGYPQLYQVRKDLDYNRFDRFHVNVGPHGAGVDEVFQMLSGGGFVIHQRLDDGQILTLKRDCPDENSGWLGTYSGARSHIGSISSATVGSKLLVQAFGSPEWTLTYVDQPVS